jgi:hypothetical protein
MDNVHSVDGLRIRCGRFFGVVRGGRCSECCRSVRVICEGELGFIKDDM